MEWSNEGDLVVGFAYTRFENAAIGGPGLVNTEFFCAVRPFGGTFSETSIERQVMTAIDPNVSLLGGGASLRIFYAYEGLDGVRLRSSDDAGQTWSDAVVVGDPGAHTPSVFARSIAGETRVDLLYLAHNGVGQELRAARWPDWDRTPIEEYRLTTATLIDAATATEPLVQSLGANGRGQRLTQIAWMGYDAVLDGDELVVVYDEETFETEFVCYFAQNFGSTAVTTGSLPTGSTFTIADPPPLAPGMTEPVRAVNRAHRHQLRLVRID